MKTQIKQQWVQALRSNEYTQAVGNLRTDKGYCCLGVLCDLYAKETGDEWTCLHSAEEPPYDYYRMKNQTSVLPDSIAEWAGLYDQNPFVNLYEDDKTTLADLNDKGKAFEEIADIIEEQL
jgi:hypothetical protein